MTLPPSRQKSPYKRLSFPKGLRLGCLFAGALIYVAAPAFAASIAFEPSISEVGAWDSNPLLLTTDAKPLYGSTTTPRLVAKSQTPTTELVGDVSVSHNVFNQKSFDSTDAHGKLFVSRRNQRFEAGARQTVDYDTTRTSELTTFGREAGVLRHLGLSFAPYASFLVNPKDKISLTGRLLVSRYDSQAYTDYNVYALTPSWSHSFTPLQTGSIFLHAQRYVTQSGFKRTVDSVGPSLGWNVLFSPRLSGRFSLGFEASQEKSPNGNEAPWQVNHVFSGVITYKGEQDTIDFSALRQQQPNSNGTQRLLTSFSIKERHAINENLFWDVFVGYQFSRSDSSAANDLKNLLTATTGLTYRATEAFDIFAKYKYRHEALTNRDDIAMGNAFTIGLTLRPYGRIAP